MLHQFLARLADKPWVKQSKASLAGDQPARRCAPQGGLQASERRHLRGLGLIELMVVVAMVGVLLALAVPSMAPLVRQRQLEQAARLLADDLLVARNEAIKRNAVVLVCADASDTTGACKASPTAADWARGWRVCWADAANSACATSVLDRPNPIRVRDALNPAVALTAPATALRFAPDGTLDASVYSAFELRAVADSAVTWRLNFMRSGSISLRRA